MAQPEAAQEGGTEKGLAAWEQHASIITIPRFNYSAALSLPHSDFAGLLITCPLDREKSATKEALSILKEYISIQSEEINHYKIDSHCSLYTPEEDAAELAYSRKKTRQNDAYALEEDSGKGQRPGDKHGKVSELGLATVSVDVVGSAVPDDNQSPSPATKELEQTDVRYIGTDGSVPIEPFGISVLKLSCKGIIFIILTDGSALNTVDFVSKVLHEIQIGAISPLKWCQRLFPVQATCLYTKDSLRSTTIRLVKQYLKGKAFSSEILLKYAVGFNRRGVDLDVKLKDIQKDTEISDAMGRMECIQVVALAVKEAFFHTVVDLSSPQMVVMVEILPLAGVHNPPVCAMAVLASDLVNVKPKLCIKSLVRLSGKRKSMH